MKKYQWSVALAIIGGVLSTKSADIRPVAVVEGCLIGALLGFVLGWLLDRRLKKKLPYS
jgi:NhaP-type Na+/H+ or K+/H+ antiporter